MVAVGHGTKDAVTMLGPEPSSWDPEENFMDFSANFHDKM